MMENKGELPQQYFEAVMNTPLGRLVLQGGVAGLTRLRFATINEIKEINNSQAQQLPECLRLPLKELTEYFNGQRRFFEMKLFLQGTRFQKAVWQALQEIPYGETVSYSELAHQLGNKQAARAVGNACNANPVPLIIPCHRVVGKNPTSGGYGAGMARKLWLLDFEKSFS